MAKKAARRNRQSLGVTKNALVELQKKYNSDGAIAKALKVSRQSVIMWRQKMGIGSIRERNIKRNEQILALSKKGESGYAIAKKLGISLAVVYRLIKLSKPAKKKAAPAPKKKAAKKVAVKKVAKKAKVAKAAKKAPAKKAKRGKKR